MDRQSAEFSAPALSNQQNELSTTGAAAKEQHEIQSAITIAKKIPRNERNCFGKLMVACSRPSFAEEAAYSFPRGKKEDGSPNMVSGPSVNLAREAGRIWGNIRFGLYIIRDDDDSMVIRGWAWDVETNTKVEHDDSFKKLIYRKDGGWKTPDERDLRELVNRRGAILVRNSLLQVMPKDYIEDALFQCEKTLDAGASNDPDSTMKRLIVDFGSINVTVVMLEERLGHPLDQSTPKELSELRLIYQSIADGNSRWSEYVASGQTLEESGKAKVEEVRAAMKARNGNNVGQDPDPQQAQQSTSASEASRSNQSAAPQGDDAVPFNVANDDLWRKMIEFMSSDAYRISILKNVKASFNGGTKNASTLPIAQRSAFLLSINDEARRLKRAIEWEKM